MRLLFAGTPATAIPSLQALVDAGHDVVAVATNPDARQGRGGQLATSPVGQRARELDIPLLQPAKAREPWFVDAFRQLDLDAAVIVAWGCLIPDTLLGAAKHGWINLHFSMLPAWRGAAPVQRAIMDGQASTGVTTFQLVHDLDAGPIFRQEAVAIGSDETTGQLLNRLSVIGASTLLDTLFDVAAGVDPQPQPTAGVTLAPKVTIDDAHIDWTRPAKVIHDLVRAVTPSPGAWCLWRNQRLKVLATAHLADSQLAPGELMVSRQAVLVGTSGGCIDLKRVQAPGKSPMSGVDWARGARLTAGDQLG